MLAGPQTDEILRTGGGFKIEASGGKWCGVNMLIDDDGTPELVLRVQTFIS